MNVETRYKQLDGIDLFKFLMAFCVIAIHVNSKSVTGGQKFPFAIQWLISLAVPFFFICSGYLLGRRVSTEKRASALLLREKSLKLIKLFSYWLIVYLPIAVIYYYIERVGAFKAIGSYIMSVLLNGESPYAWPLWFIYSLAITFLILSFIRFSKKNIIIVFLLFLCVLVYNYYNYSGLCFKAIKLFTHRSLEGGGLCSRGDTLECMQGKDKELVYCWTTVGHQYWTVYV